MSQIRFSIIMFNCSENRYAINFITIKIWCGLIDNGITKVFIYASQMVKSLYPFNFFSFLFVFFSNIKIKLLSAKFQLK